MDAGWFGFFFPLLCIHMSRQPDPCPGSIMTPCFTGCPCPHPANTRLYLIPNVQTQNAWADNRPQPGEGRTGVGQARFVANLWNLHLPTRSEISG
ncbi:MAG: hypothetical protein BYD32DRAFT_413662 [Podila humilis]|nr:MAG: hypothetical protein BYD32DRAFT_413662 [Podila humilis]